MDDESQGNAELCVPRQRVEQRYALVRGAGQAEFAFGASKFEILANDATMSPRKMRKTEVGKRRILVVDDESTVRDLIKFLLKFEGHDVETAGSGPEALAMIQKEEFDLILTDFAMPEMTGEELATAIKTLLPKQPVGMITAYATMLQASGEQVKGTEFLISKPFVLTELRAAVARTLPKENE